MELSMVAVRSLIRSWWLLLFLLCCGVALESALGRLHIDQAKLQEQWSALQIEKEKLLLEQADLKMQVNSQSDAAWVELTLMRKLGLVPEGQTKVYFN